MLSSMMHCFGRVSARTYAILAACILLIIGPALIALDLTYLSEWVTGRPIGDFYAYLGLTGLISAWSLVGLFFMAKRSVKGVKIFALGLFCLVVLQMIIGLVHVILLFTVYRPALMTPCLQRQPTRLFWWSLGYEDNAELQKIYDTCAGQWNRFAWERVGSWAVFSVLSALALYMVHRYYRFLKGSQSVHPGKEAEWTDEEMGEKRRSRSNDDDMLLPAAGPPAYKKSGGGRKKRKNKKQRNQARLQQEQEQEEQERLAEENQEDDGEEADEEQDDDDSEQQPLRDDAEAYAQDMHKQREKLYAEIAKRRQAKKSLNRRSMTSANPQRQSFLEGANGVHPLDLTQTAGSTTSPPPPPSQEQPTPKVHDGDGGGDGGGGDGSGDAGSDGGYEPPPPSSAPSEPSEAANDEGAWYPFAGQQPQQQQQKQQQEQTPPSPPPPPLPQQQ